MRACTLPFAVLFLLGGLASGCAGLLLRASPLFIDPMSEALYEECDLGLAESALPSQLKLLEGLLKSDPQNEDILAALSMGLGGYSLLFVEDEDPERAADLYERARDYGLRALGDRGRTLKDPSTPMEGLQAALASMGPGRLKALSWTTVAWSAWINLNLDKPAALIALPRVQACLERLLEIDAAYFHGLPCILKGASLCARPSILGGDTTAAGTYFEKALEISQGRFFLVQYFFARYYAVRVQDKTLFHALLREVRDGDPRGLPEMCLINRAMQRKAEALEKDADEFFF